MIFGIPIIESDWLEPGQWFIVDKGRVRTHLCQERHDDPAECGGDCSPAILAYHWEENRKW